MGSPPPPIQTIYLDCFAGISGDMFLAALLDAGLPDEVLREELTKLELGPVELNINREEVSGIAALSLQIITGSNQPARGWPEIQQLIIESKLAESIRATALKIFKTLARAEARIHNCPIAEVHFHEVGAMDSIVDIIGAAVGINHFRGRRITSSPLPMPRGFVNCRHGRLPLPAPAVCEILKEIPVYGLDCSGEMVTPTGAAIVKALADDFGAMPPMRIKRIGYGRGNNQFTDRPNLLRVLIGQSETVAEAGEVEVIETNLDDWSPEGYPFLAEKLFAQGALDVSLIPIQMKKGRPGFQLTVICRPGQDLPLKHCLLTETSAIGLRFRRERRLTLPRRTGLIKTTWGMVRVKEIKTPEEVIISPEYEDCRRVALANDLPLKTVYQEINRCRPADLITEEED